MTKRLTEQEKRFITESELTTSTIASIIGCSPSTVRYYKNRGIFKKKTGG